MKCKIIGCQKDAAYKSDQVCQMHYFRFMRNGTYDTVRKRAYRYVNPAGYHAIYEPDHPLAQQGGYVYEHRFYLFNEKGYSIKECEMCGVTWSWGDICSSHVDHIDEDKSNNKPSNLRPLCNSCNTKRTKINYSKLKGCSSITFEGKTMTATEWSRDERVSVSGSTIKRRLASGMDIKKSLFMKSKTYKAKCKELESNGAD